MAYTSREITEYAHEHISFGLKDSKGREIGALITRAIATFSENEPGKTWGYTKPAGTYLTFCPHATRNGKTYGACQHERYFDTEAEREDAISAYLANARKRAAKAA